MRDGGLAAGVDVAFEVGAAVAHVDAVDEVEAVVVPVRGPGDDGVTVLLEGGDDGGDTAEDWGMRLHVAVAGVETDC